MGKNERRNRGYGGFMDLEKAYNRVDREGLWQVLRMYDLDGRLLNGIREYVYMYVCMCFSGLIVV